MPRRLAATSIALLLACAIAGCTSTAGTQTPPADASTDASNGTTTGGLPGCDAVTVALGALVGSLVLNEPVGDAQLAPESYDQRACVYTSTDENVRLGVTISAIPFLKEELDSYRLLPTAIPDDRATALNAVLQTRQVEGGSADHLDSTLYLFDTVYSIAIEGSSAVEPVTLSLPQLTIGAATDAAFAIRALLD